MEQDYSQDDVAWQLIDIGCGGGEFLRYMINSRLVTHLVGIDVDK
jgi:cyclopropane fatty-acyl-phospholipid synthase-like methyltransferase